MARGWESKAVEAQQDEASRRRPAGVAPKMSAADRAALERRRTLELARARTLADLKSVLSPAHRAMLERALEALDEQIQKLP